MLKNKHWIKRQINFDEVLTFYKHVDVILLSDYLVKS